VESPKADAKSAIDFDVHRGRRKFPAVGLIKPAMHRRAEEEIPKRKKRRAEHFRGRVRLDKQTALDFYNRVESNCTVTQSPRARPIIVTRPN
jgi:hypothetical protein